MPTTRSLAFLFFDDLEVCRRLCKLNWSCRSDGSAAGIGRSARRPRSDHAPTQVTAEDRDGADRIVALKQAEHLPLLQERFLAWDEKGEFCQVDDGLEALGLIERESMSLVARMIRG
jgi:hypothetical protein